MRGHEDATGRALRDRPRSIELQSGYRSDVLVQARSEPGRYRLIDAASAANVSLRGIAEPENVLDLRAILEDDQLWMDLTIEF